MSEHADRLYVRAEALQRLARDLLVRHEVPVEDATTIGRCLVEADLRGVETHGVVRLPHYLNRVRLGLINPNPDIKIKRPTPVAMLMDGDDGFGFVLAARAVTEAISIAMDYGVGLVSIRGSSHFGMAASYVLQAERAGFMSMVFTNASRAMPPFGGKEPLLGTSPFAAGAPGGTQPPFILDMSVAVAARGKIRLAAKRGTDVPEGFGLDKDGRNTTDPNAILDGGVVLPAAGPKGSALAMMMDIFSGVFSGSAFGGDVPNHQEDFSKPQNVGHFVMVINPALFMTMDQFTARMDTLTVRVKGVAPAEGFNEILVSGEPEARVEQQRLKHGIPLPAAELDALRKEALRLDVDFPELSAQSY